MAILIDGVSAQAAERGEALIRDVLGARDDADGLHVVAYRLPNGQWRVFVTDDNSVEIVDPALAARIAAALAAIR